MSIYPGMLLDKELNLTPESLSGIIYWVGKPSLVSEGMLLPLLPLLDQQLTQPYLRTSPFFILKRLCRY